MKAHKFVAEFGIEEAKRVLRGAPALGCYFLPAYQQYFTDKHGFVYVLGMFGYFTPSLGMSIEYLNEHGLKIAELKQVVESLKLVEIHSYEKSKEIVKNAPSDDHFYSWKLGNSGVYDKTVNIGELKQAIADYESIYGGEHV